MDITHPDDIGDTPDDPVDTWASATLYTDGSVRNHGQDNPSEVALGYQLTDNGELIAENGLYLGKQPIGNTEAELLAIIAGIYAAKDHNYTVLYANTDNKPVVEHLTGIYPIESDNLRNLLETTDRLLNTFEHYIINHEYRDNTYIENAHNTAHDVFPDTD